MKFAPAFIILAGLALLYLLLFPSVSVGPSNSQRGQAKNDTVQIATAIRGYITEYNHPPAPDRGEINGEILATLTGSNIDQNPRRIVFLEVAPTKRGRSGLRDGTYVDPWGAPYQYVCATGTNTVVRAGIDAVEIPKEVAVWTDPRLCPDAASLSESEKQRRHSVKSWE